MALEAMEGTDETIRRAGRIAGRARGREGGEAEAGHALRRAGRGDGHARRDGGGGRARCWRSTPASTLLIDQAAFLERADRTASRSSASAAASRRGRCLSVTLRAGVVGVGALGQHHARVCRERPGSHARGRPRRGRGARRRGRGAARLPRLSRPRPLLAETDALSVAVPTVEHHAVARQALEAGKRRAGREADDGDARRGRRPHRRARRAAGASCRSATSSASTRRRGRCSARPRRRASSRCTGSGSFPPAQPRRRRRARPDDPRPRHRARARRLRGRAGRGGRRARADAEGRHRQRPAALRLRPDRQPDGEPRLAEKVRKFRVFAPRTYVSADFAAREAQVYRLEPTGRGAPRDRRRATRRPPTRSRSGGRSRASCEGRRALGTRRVG